jgi:polyribonucleotide nucleotidyltransferase
MAKGGKGRYLGPGARDGGREEGRKGGRKGGREGGRRGRRRRVREREGGDFLKNPRGLPGDAG